MKSEKGTKRTFVFLSIITEAIKRRWRWSEGISLRSAGLTPSEAEWERDWEDAVRAASAEPRPRPQENAAPHYVGLEQLHVFALAHVMRRPVVVFADVALRVSLLLWFDYDYFLPEASLQLSFNSVLGI